MAPRWAASPLPIPQFLRSESRTSLVGAMSADDELEEGEACDESAFNCDPDTAFSYLDEKLRVVLGDVQKDFEGEVSAEKLGSKYGGYGSFLPAYERRPPLYLAQTSTLVKAPTTPASDAARGGKKSLNVGVVERATCNAVAATSLTVKSNKFHNHVGPSPISDVKKGHMPLDNPEAMEDELSNSYPNFAPKEATPSADQKKVTLRIKVGQRKNSELYNGLGLEDDSSVSMADSEDGETSHSELESSPEKSPFSMIQIMTSHCIPGGSILSPMQNFLSQSKERNAAPSPFKLKQSKLPPVKEIGEPLKLTPVLEQRKEVHMACGKIEMTTEENIALSYDMKLEENGMDSLKKNKKVDMDRSAKDGRHGKLKLSTKLSGKKVSTPANALERMRSNTPEEKPSKHPDLRRVSISEKGSPLHIVKDELKDASAPWKEADSSDFKYVMGGKVKDAENRMKEKRVKEKSVEKEERKLMDMKEASFNQKERQPVDGDFLKERVKIKLKADSSDAYSTDKASEPELSGETRKASKTAKILKDVSKSRENGKESLNEFWRDPKRAMNVKDMSAKDRKRNSFREGFKNPPNSGNKKALRDSLKDDTKMEMVESLKKEGKGERFSYKDNLRLFESESEQEFRIDNAIFSASAVTDSSDAFSTDQASEPELSGETRKASKKKAKMLKDVSRVNGKNNLNESRREINTKAMDRKNGVFREGYKDPPDSANKESFRDMKAEIAGSFKKESKGDAFLSKGNSRFFETESKQEVSTESMHKATNMSFNTSSVAPVDQQAALGAVAPTVVITEDWVQCDKCEQWRLLPPGIKPEALPKKWRCKMLTWLEGMNSCKLTEDETTHAVYARYAPPPPHPPPPDPFADFVPALEITKALPTDGNPESLNYQTDFDKYDRPKLGKRTHTPLSGFANHQTASDVGTPTKKRNSTNVGNAFYQCIQGSTESDLGFMQAPEDQQKAKTKEKLKPLRASDGTGDELQRSKKRTKDPAGLLQRSLDTEKDVASDVSGPSKKRKNSHDLYERLNHDRASEDSMRDMQKSLHNDSGRGESVGYATRVRESEASSKYNSEKMSRRIGDCNEVNDRHSNAKPREVDASFGYKERDGRDGRYDRQYSLEKGLREKEREWDDGKKREKALMVIDAQTKGKDKREERSKFSSSPYEWKDASSPLHQDGCIVGSDGQEVRSEARKKKSEASKKKEIFNERAKVRPDTAIAHQPEATMSATRPRDSSERGGEEPGGASTSKESRGAERCSIALKNSHSSAPKNLGKVQNVVSQSTDTIGGLLAGKSSKPAGDQAEDSVVATIKSCSGVNTHTGRNEPGGSSIASIHSAISLAMREAKDLKHRADRLKAKEGHGPRNGSTDIYFRAGLKFLHAASMLESVYAEGAKIGENTQSITIYADTAKLCEYCAIAYERTRALAAAALAHKCVGLAHMRVVMAKTSCASRDRAELLAASQLLLPGESPSSSLSDVDNLSHQAQTAEKLSLSAPARAAASPSLPGNFVLLARNRPNYSRVLQFVSDVGSAMEAFNKCENAYAALDRSSASSEYGAEGMQAVKNAVDANFFDVENLLRLVRLALEAIQH